MVRSLINKTKLALLLSAILILNSSINAQSTDSLLIQIEQIPSDTEKIHRYNELFLQVEFQDTVLANDALQKALKLASHMQYKKGLAETYKHVGYFMEDKGNYSGATSNYRRMLSISQDIGDLEGIATAYNLQGNICTFKSEYLDALNYYKKSLEIAERLNNKPLIGKCINNLGTTYFSLEKFDMALDMYQKCLSMSDDLGDQKILATAKDNIANIYRFKKEYTKALEFHKQALKIKEASNDIYGMAGTLHNLGVITSYLSDSLSLYFDESLDYYNKAIKLFRETNNRIGEARCLHDISYLYMRKKNYEKSLEYSAMSIEISNDLGTVSDVANAYNVTAICYENLGNYEEAFRNYKKFMTLTDSIRSNQSIEKITKIEMQYEFDKIQKEKEFEQRKKDIIKEQELVRQKAARNYLFGGIALMFIILVLILRSYIIKRRDNALLGKQKNEIETKNLEITSSIKYAKRIQEAIFPPENLIRSLLPDSFVLYMPKDIVSGDFYWVYKTANRILFAVVDCTGHGVPGAFMSIVGYNGLNSAIHEYGLTDPGEILNKLNEIVNQTLRQKYEESSIRDGMDIALCSISSDSTKLEYAGANNPIFIVRNKELIEYKAVKQPIGHFLEKEQIKYSTVSADLEKNDMIYLFSDGYVDQFGGKTDQQRERGGYKIKKAGLKTLLKDFSDKPTSIQHDLLKEELIKWKGDLMQIDDICIMGVRVI